MSEWPRNSGPVRIQVVSSLHHSELMNVYIEYFEMSLKFLSALVACSATVDNWDVSPKYSFPLECSWELFSVLLMHGCHKPTPVLSWNKNKPQRVSQTVSKYRNFKGCPTYITTIRGFKVIARFLFPLPRYNMMSLASKWHNVEFLQF